MVAIGRVERLNRTDWIIVLVIMALLAIGLLMVFSASYHYTFGAGTGEQMVEPRMADFLSQILWTLLGVLIVLVLAHVDYHLYRQWAVWIAVVVFVPQLILAVLGIVTGQVSRWVLANATRVQPSELVKIGGVIFIAAWLNGKRNQLRQFSVGFVTFAAILGVMAGTILAQHHFSTTLLFVITAAVMFLVAGADLRYVFVMFLVGGAALALVGLLAPYRLERFRTWLGVVPPGEQSEQMKQILYAANALQRGGLFGVGLGQSRYKFIISAAHTDCIFAIFGEEFGFIGVLLLFGLYALFAWRGWQIARQATDLFGMLLATGLVTYIILQASLHIAVLNNALPATGTVLPFMSYGGSSLVTCFMALGILLNIARGGGGWGQRFIR